MDLLDEVKEDLQQEQIKKFWAQYGRYFIGFIALLVVGTAVNAGYNQYRISQSTRDATAYHAALDLAESKDRKMALEKLAALSDSGGAGYKTLALFSEASLMQRQGDGKGAMAAFDRLSKNTSIDPLYRELATILRATIALDEKDADFAAISASLEPLTGAGKPWRFSALELQAAAAMEQGDKKKAAEIFQRIASDVNTPSDMRQRADRFATVLSF